MARTHTGSNPTVICSGVWCSPRYGQFTPKTRKSDRCLLDNDNTQQREAKICTVTSLKPLVFIVIVHFLLSVNLKRLDPLG